MEVKDSTQSSYRSWLTERMEEKRKKNPNYSLRAFARNLNLPPSSLSQIMLGKRPLTLKSALAIADRVELSPRERKQFIQSVLLEKLPQDTSPLESQQYVQLENDTFAVISDWYHYAILSLGEIKPNFYDEEWVARQLGITRKEARGALVRLCKMHLIKRVGRGFKQSTPPMDIQCPTTSLALRKYHRQNLMLAEKALEDEPIELRDFNSFTMAADIEKIPEAKIAIRKFRDEIARILETHKPSRVYTLAIQLFPVSKNIKHSEKNP